MNNEMNLPINEIVHGDCMDVMKTFPTHSIDFIFTDPPYGMNKEGVNDDNWALAYKDPFLEMYRVLKSDSFLLTFAGQKEIKNVLMSVPKFKYKWTIVCYAKTMNRHSYVGLSKWMPLMVFEKGDATYNKGIRDVLEHHTKSIDILKKHPTAKTPYWVRKCLPAFTEEGDIVLDPFAGIGSTAIGCKQMMRKYIGIEIQKKYVNMARNTLKIMEDPLVNFM